MGVVSLMSSAARRSIQAWCESKSPGFCVPNHEEQPRNFESDRLADGRGCQFSFVSQPHDSLELPLSLGRKGGRRGDLRKSILILTTMLFIFFYLFSSKLVLSVVDNFPVH